MKILVAIVLTFLFIGCSDNTKEEVQVEASSVDKVTKQVQVIKEKAVKAAENVKAQAAENMAVVEKKVAEVMPKVENAVSEAKTEVKNVVVAVEKEITSVTKSTSSLDAGKTIFGACAGCHGLNAEKQALGKSKVIKGWSVAQVTKALNGYKDGSYGGAMKGLMKSQASKLSDADIKSVSEYISSL